MGIRLQTIYMETNQIPKKAGVILTNLEGTNLSRISNNDLYGIFEYMFRTTAEN